MNLQKKLANLLASTKRKRPYYCEVEYIENTGTVSARNWISTGIVPDTTTRWEVRLSFNNTSTGKLMGCGYTNPTRFNLGLESSKFRFAFNSWFDANENITTPDTNIHTWIMDASSKTFTIDGYSTTTTQTFGETTFPITLFGRCNSANGSTETTNTVVGKIYYSKIWKNGVLVNDLIPVIDWNMTPCMYDKVTGELLYNMNSSGTGFTVGREIHRVDYLESTGTQWIDTGVSIDTSTDIIDFDFELIDTNVYKWFFGEYDENARIGLGSGDGENKRNYLYQQSATKVNDSEMYGARHKFYADQTGGYLNGTKIRSYVSFASTSTIYLFNINIDSTSNYKCATKVYRYKQYRNNTLIRDLIPAIDENGIGFLFDRVTHNIFDNAGTGAFNYPVVELDYIQSSGTQYIDTGYAFQEDFSWEIDFDGITKGATLFGGRTSSTRTALLYQKSATQGVETTCPINGMTGDQTPFQLADLSSGKHKVKMSVASNKGSVWVDDVQIYNEQSFTGTYISGTTQAIFADNFGSSVSEYTSSKVYSVRMWQGSSVVRNFIPAYVNGKAGMYDKVSKTFFENAGTGNFVAGKVKESEYLE